MRIAVIPARGGSKRIPRKNIKVFNGKPIIAWAILAAQESELFDHIVVSTDDDEIKKVSEFFGAIVPFIRPAHLADDHTPTAPVISHAITEMERLYHPVDFACCIYPCSPLLLASDLIEGFDMLRSTGVDFVYPVVEYPHPIFRSMRKSKDGKMEFIYPQYELTRTQDMEKTFHDSGQFYWGKAKAWKELKKMHTDGLGMEIPSHRVVDIDTEDDWKKAELIARLNAL
ncbi:MAG: pseudaminic acid cytidylyltransferase [Candidatus Marinimicrobia bacterium]|jgi:pseudaminic acid cytidylyltransferase|nr:pseudaminic acid cytidylyltransferase [Candidatus Neomarinimicrobiota bacterium]